MSLRAPRGETVAWSTWVSGRYRGVRVKNRAGVHLSASGRYTLCMRRADPKTPVEPEHLGKLCPGCRATTHAAYAMAHPDRAGA